MLWAGGGVDIIIMIVVIYKKGYAMKYSLQMVSIILLLMLVGCGGDTGGSGDITTSANESHPLFDMLKRVPMEFADTPVSYTDFRAVEDALPYVERPASGELFYGGWPGYTRRWYISANNIWDAIPIASREGSVFILQTVGFEIRDINRLFTFGNPPNNGIIWSGDFDEQAIRITHTARGYSAVTINDAEAWCYAGDCSTQMRPDPQGRELGNIFDPMLGRKIPFLMWDDTLISTPQQSILEGVTNLSENRLYDNADVRALAQAATAPDGLLVNWMLWNVDIVSVPSRPLTESEREGLADTTQFSTYEYQNLPPYDAIAIADRQEGDRMVALLMVTYNDEATAQSGAAELSARVASFTDKILRRNSDSLTPILDRIPGAIVSHEVYTSDTGRYVAIVRIEYDTPTLEQALSANTLSEDAYAPDARAFRMFIDGFARRSFYPLWTVWNK